MSKTAIYSIKNKKTGRVYIGQSKHPANRWSQHKHLLKTGDSTIPLLQMEYNEYGESAFEFSIIEQTDNPNDRERYHIDRKI